MQHWRPEQKGAAQLRAEQSKQTSGEQSCLAEVAWPQGPSSQSHRATGSPSTSDVFPAVLCHNWAVLPLSHPKLGIYVGIELMSTTFCWFYGDEDGTLKQQPNVLTSFRNQHIWHLCEPLMLIIVTVVPEGLGSYGNLSRALSGRQDTGYHGLPSGYVVHPKRHLYKDSPQPHWNGPYRTLLTNAWVTRLK